MKTLFLLPILLLSLISFSANAETVLYCQEDLSTGLVKQKGVWKTVNFNPSRHTIKFNNDYSRLEGLTMHPMECSNHYSLVVPYKDVIFCKYASDTFIYDSQKMRFTYASLSVAGYANDPTASDTENLSAGACKDF